ncbi:N-acetyl-gamma-glutamyl-phosphate reductase [Natroniella sulfidigena]|nr:N-acetyl-gamma-glutamyl-phosphate reductase [Natroniella sulfidigena]MCK8817988.1 N-acetyl-gamma-glutamyl-phosphate reductase [Natroniella sulfidigena]
MNVSVVGATGYTGVELVRLLADHPEVKLKTLTSNSFSEEKISDIYPHLSTKIDIECQKLNIEQLQEESDVVFTALPHGISMTVVPKLVEAGLKVIDLSGDYRYQELAKYEEWYQEHNSPQLLEQGVYGLPELNREQIATSELVANPGCYPTASILALAPLLDKGWIDQNSIIIDAKSGTTGAGRKVSLGTHFCEVDSSFKAYKVANHRHTSEIEEKLSLVADKEINLSFTPHLLPIKRGILATIYADLKEDLSSSTIIDYYRQFYKGDQFVRIMPGERLPEIKFVAGSNYCDLGLEVDQATGRVIIISAIDNLVKGSAGQAIQNLNLMAGWREDLGLEDAGLYL